jgi:RNA polymerase sigma-70 factor (ECF subfamily)
MTRLELTDADIERLEQYTQDVDVLAMLADLPADQRVAIAGHILGEQDYSELARDLRCSEAVVRQRVSRGLRTLRQLLEGSL